MTSAQERFPKIRRWGPLRLIPINHGPLDEQAEDRPASDPRGAVEWAEGGGDIKSMTQVDECRLRDKAYAVLGVAMTFGKVYPQLYSVDLAADATELGVPVYFAEGRHDKNAMPSLAEQHYEHLRAPQKALVWFERSGHDLCFEEPDQFQALLVDKVLAQTRTGPFMTTSQWSRPALADDVSW